jgi:hypothetical protein
MATIEIISDEPYSAHDFEVAWGRIKRFINSGERTKVYSLPEFAVVMFKKNDLIRAKILRKANPQSI